MGERSAIEWTDATWNPWRGCTQVSPGCAHCYMFRDQRRYGRDPEVVVRAAPATFDAPLRWKEPRRVFTCSWSDWFHEAADDWRDEAWDIIRRTPHLTYQILTKRPEMIAGRLPRDWGREGYPNVWLGVSVESQRQDWRAAWLCQFPAAVRFVSAEPLLGPLWLTRVNPYRTSEGRLQAEQRADFLGVDVLEWPRHPPVFFVPGARIGRIDWVIVGGESGPDARPMAIEWARRLRDECTDAGVAFFLKQLGGPANAKRGGAEAVLDGRTWTQMPRAVHA
jgi:protein gp37